MRRIGISFGMVVATATVAMAFRGFQAGGGPGACLLLEEIESQIELLLRLEGVVARWWRYCWLVMNKTVVGIQLNPQFMGINLSLSNGIVDINVSNIHDDCGRSQKSWSKSIWVVEGSIG
ncbi:hypothetical protein Patl1_11187 [Pistacia atlantica]|uniref:Uncharacterized protein n=1 Tax=Pistacia atlantica TaxID=434234 RepID=A0ACC1A989_9ROSI|nr:hypothetical protein Patl1_11187 [Pistacia atlantica]